MVNINNFMVKAIGLQNGLPKVKVSYSMSLYDVDDNDKLVEDVIYSGDLNSCEVDFEPVAINAAGLNTVFVKTWIGFPDGDNPELALFWNRLLAFKKDYSGMLEDEAATISLFVQLLDETQEEAEFVLVMETPFLENLQASSIGSNVKPNVVTLVFHESYVGLLKVEDKPAIVSTVNIFEEEE